MTNHELEIKLKKLKLPVIEVPSHKENLRRLLLAQQEQKSASIWVFFLKLTLGNIVTLCLLAMLQFGIAGVSPKDKPQEVLISLANSNLIEGEHKVVVHNFQTGEQKEIVVISNKAMLNLSLNPGFFLATISDKAGNTFNSEIVVSSLIINKQP